MECCWPENLPSKPKRAIDQLIEGRQLATQLRSLLSNSLGDDESTLPPAKDLLLKILNSFQNSLMILNSDDPDHELMSPIPTKTHGTKSESSEGSCRSISTLKDRRGCYKRRKNTQTWTKDTATLVDDGHAWRKYGQKVILNAKFPRHYYRCTHKFDQGCQATKHVQRIQEEPQKYRTTYIGQHSCRTFLKAPELILQDPSDPSTTTDSSILLSFDNTISNKQDSHFLISSFSSIKQERKEEKPAMSSDDIITHTHNHNQSSSSDYLLSPDRTPDLEPFGHMSVLSESDNGDVISGVMVPPVDFDDDVFSFNF
ncbi:WRKY DNA-binding transcription factor 70-like [Juglans microcarpa x Juglans regia]|uniref:WRKY DNA-binding transcription factor 70-like n=1 Tax=Juglans microcarpa x Juglans regia TaxID=2249226 RepID=UPI001B7DD26C|nr:WRKY DNA-binding transcription factor 70-like [Juglans microcarpa x Juglans regia]